VGSVKTLEYNCFSNILARNYLFKIKG